jgi:hypothetical protein
MSPVWTIDVALLLDSAWQAVRARPASEEKKDSVPRQNDICGISLTSTCLGVNPEHRHSEFYQDTIDEDEASVEQSFRVAAERGISCAVRVAAEEELAERLLSGRCAFIVLVDSARFSCAASRACTSAAATAVQACACALQALGSCCYHCGCASGGGASSFSQFAGHFVVLVGFDPTTQMFLVRNPAALVESMCTCTAASLRNARSSQGTDYDTICVTFSS